MNQLSIVLRLVVVASFIAGVGLIAAPSISAQETAFAEGDEVIVVGDELNLRESPGLESPVVTELVDGAPLTILSGPVEADDDFWYQVLADEATVGWVSEEFIEVLVEEPESVVGDEIVVVLGPLNMREAPGLESPEIGSLETDDVALVIDGPQNVDEIDWYLVETDDGSTGWIASDYVQLIPAAPDQFAFVATDALNVRVDATLDAEVTVTLDEGAVVQLLGETSETEDIVWTLISSGEGDATTEGWVDEAFLTDALTMDNDAEVVDGPLNLRESASTDAEILETLETGALVTLAGGPFVDEETVWFEVIAGEQTGFVAGEFLGPNQVDEEA